MHTMSGGLSETWGGIGGKGAVFTFQSVVLASD